MIKLNDPTTALVRFLADFLCVIPNRFSFLVECKSGKGNTSHYAYNLDSYNTGLRLVELGVRILCVFGDGEYGRYKAEWIENLPVGRLINKTSRLKTFNGSQRPKRLHFRFASIIMLCKSYRT